MRPLSKSLHVFLRPHLFEQACYYLVSYSISDLEHKLQRATAEKTQFVKSDFTGEFNETEKNFILVYKSELNNNSGFLGSSHIKGKYYEQDKNSTAIEILVVPNYDQQI